MAGKNSAPNIAAAVPQPAWVSARHFRPKGRVYRDAQGRERIAGGGTWVDGKEGEWVDLGVVCRSAILTRPPGRLTRIWNFILNLWRTLC